jgi:hypothetical protein
MESQETIPRNFQRLKVLSAAVGVGVVGAMSLLTVVFGAVDDVKAGSTVVIADTTTQGAPPVTPTTPSAAPGLKSSSFVGGDWSGMGKFAGGDWP